MSTVLSIGGTTPVHLSGLRSPAQATSKIFSKLWPFLVQPLTIWMRSRLPEVGSFTAHTDECRRLGLRPAADRRPSARPSRSRSSPSRRSRQHVRPSYSHPPKKRTLMCGPLTRKGFLARHAVEDAKRACSPRPTRRSVRRCFRVRASNMPPTRCAGHARLDRPVGESVAAEKVVLAVGHGGVMRVGRGAEAELVRVEALGVLQCEAVFQRLPGIAANDMRNASGRVAQQDRHDLEVGELVIGREQRDGSPRCP